MEDRCIRVSLDDKPVFVAPTGTEIWALLNLLPCPLGKKKYIKKKKNIYIYIYILDNQNLIFGQNKSVG